MVCGYVHGLRRFHRGHLCMVRTREQREARTLVKKKKEKERTHVSFPSVHGVCSVSSQRIVHHRSCRVCLPLHRCMSNGRIASERLPKPRRCKRRRVGAPSHQDHFVDGVFMPSSAPRGSNTHLGPCRVASSIRATTCGRRWPQSTEPTNGTVTCLRITPPDATSILHLTRRKKTSRHQAVCFQFSHALAAFHVACVNVHADPVRKKQWLRNTPPSSRSLFSV